MKHEGGVRHAVGKQSYLEAIRDLSINKVLLSAVLLSHDTTAKLSNTHINHHSPNAFLLSPVISLLGVIILV